MPEPTTPTQTKPLPPRPLGRSFWGKIAGALGLIGLALWGTATGEMTGHPVYALAMVLMAFAFASHAVAEHTAERRYRDAYLVLMGVAVGLVLFPLLF